MIPKIIHYVWFGNPQKPDIVLKCIESWKRILPGYQIWEWNETNSPIDQPFVSYCLRNRQWAYASDYVRLWALYSHGGIYLDTDMEVVIDFSDILKGKTFVSAFEVPNLINAAIIACETNSTIIKELLHAYDHILFPEPIPNLMTKVFSLHKDWIKRDDVFIGNPQQFYPCKEEHQSGNCYTIHHFEASWTKTFRAFRLHYISYLFDAQDSKFPYSKIMSRAKAIYPSLSSTKAYLWQFQLIDFQDIYIYENYLKGPRFNPIRLLCACRDLKLDFLRKLSIYQQIGFIFKCLIFKHSAK